MATKKTTTKKAKEEKAVAKAEVASHPLILGPRITEKSAIGSDKGIYTFNVALNANKTEIKKAIKKLYNVTPVKVSITQVTEKKVMRRGVIGSKGSGKKAVVFLKKGDKIAFV